MYMKLSIIRLCLVLFFVFVLVGCVTVTEPPIRDKDGVCDYVTLEHGQYKCHHW